MPTAYELLSTEECDDVLFVDLDSRRIIIPKNISVLGPTRARPCGSAPTCGASST